MFLDFVTDSLEQIRLDIDKLYSNKRNNKRSILDHLNGTVMMLENYVKHFGKANQLRVRDMQNPYKSTFQQVRPVVNETNTFTLEELARFNGKNGIPAYIAINGVVYDVTNNATWAAATHFGLSAGNDLTNAFNSCHSGSDILTRLPIVGNLI